MIISYEREIVVYLVQILVVRLMGRRQVGQMEPSELVVAMLIADLASVPMQDGGIPLYTGLVPIFTVLGLELILSALCLRSLKLRKLLCGKPVILIENGNIMQKNLWKTRITLDELHGHLREKDVLDISTVQYAILETNGNLSVFPYPKYRPASAKEAGIPTQKQSYPITVISDGRILAENLQKAKKDGRWLQQELKKRNAAPEDTWLLTVDADNKVVFYEKE